MYDRMPLRQQDAESVWIPRESIPTYRHVPDLRPPVRRPRGIGLLMFLFCVLLAVYFFATQKPAAWVKPKDAKPVAATAPAALSPGETEDLARHLENASAHLIKVSEEINRSQALIGRTIPALDRNYLNTEKTRLQSATAASEAARRYAEQARQEMEIAKNVLIERRH